MTGRYVVGILILLILAGLSLGVAPTGQPGLRGFSAEYQLRRGSILFGQVHVRLTLSGENSYLYQAQTLTSGLAAVLRKDEISESSKGHIVDGRITPERYVYHHQRPDNPRRVQLDFDWPAGRVVNRSEGDRWSMPLPAGTQDKFSQQLALMLAVQQDRRPIQFPVADGGRLKTYRFTARGRESLDTPAGPFDTLLFERSKNGRPSRSSIWLAAELNYLPVKIERRGDGAMVTMELKSASWAD